MHYVLQCMHDHVSCVLGAGNGGRKRNRMLKELKVNGKWEED